MKLSEWIKQSDVEWWEYQGTIWGDPGDPVMPKDWVLAALSDGELDGEIIDHPAISRSRDEGYYLQSGDVWVVDSHTRECVLMPVGDWYAAAEHRVNALPELRVHYDTILYDWGEGETHWQWVATGLVTAIIDWAEAVEREGEE
jgi:hypothetical protein